MSSSPSPSFPSLSLSSPVVSPKINELKMEMKDLEGKIDMERKEEAKLKTELKGIEDAIAGEKKKAESKWDGKFIGRKEKEADRIQSDMDTISQRVKSITNTLIALQKQYQRLISSPPPSLGPSRVEDVPVYLCSIENEEKGIVSQESELLFDGGNLRCDLFLPAHDALKMGCLPTSFKMKATPINSPPLAIVQMRPQLLVKFALEDEEKNIKEKVAFLEVFVDERDLNEQLEKRKSSSVSSSPSEDSPKTPPPPSSLNPPVNHVSPIKFNKGTSKGKALLGHTGMRKLRIHWDGETNHISLLDDEPWDI